MKPLFTSRFRIALSTLVLVLVLTLSLAACVSSSTGSGTSSANLNPPTIHLTKAIYVTNKAVTPPVVTVTVSYDVTVTSKTFFTNYPDPSGVFLVCTVTSSNGNTFRGKVVMKDPDSGLDIINDLAITDNSGNVSQPFTVQCAFDDGLSGVPSSNSVTATCGTSLRQGVDMQAVLLNSMFPEDVCSAPPTDTPTEPPALTPTPSFNFDQPFDRPQYLIHITGHGTVDGPVKDDSYMLYIEEPDAQGIFRLADGYGGTITYSSDFHTGPLTTPRSVCEAAAARGLPAQQWTPYNRTDSFDCSLLTS